MKAPEITRKSLITLSHLHIQKYAAESLYRKLVVCNSKEDLLTVPTHFPQIYIALQVLYGTSVGLVKVSNALFMSRIFVPNSIKWLLKLLPLIAIAWTITSIFIGLF